MLTCLNTSYLYLNLNTSYLYISPISRHTDYGGSKHGKVLNVFWEVLDKDMYLCKIKFTSTMYLRYIQETW